MTSRNYTVRPSISLMLLCLLLISGFTLKSQSNMFLKNNDLDRSKNLSIGGTIFGVDLYNPNLAFIIEGKLCYRIKHELGWVRAHYTLGWLDRIEAVTESSSSQEAVPANGTQPLRNIGGSIGINFIKREQYKIAKGIFLNSNRKDIKIPVKFLRLYGIHAGYEQFRTVIAQGSTTSYTGTVSKDYPSTVTVEATGTPMFHMTMLSLGIHRQLLEHYTLEVHSGGNVTEYKSRTTSLVFADFLFGMNMQLEDLLVPFNYNAPNTNQVKPSIGNNDPFNFYAADINEGQKKIPFGGRLGVEQISLGPVGWNMGAEIGFRPGLMDPMFNLYILVKVGVSFNMRAK